jgi:hypothetical protein
VTADQDLAAAYAERFGLASRRDDETGAEFRERIARALHARGHLQLAVEALTNQSAAQDAPVDATPGADLGDLAIRHLAATASDGPENIPAVVAFRARWRGYLITALSLLTLAAAVLIAVIVRRPEFSNSAYTVALVGGLVGAGVVLAVLSTVWFVQDLVWSRRANSRKTRQPAYRADAGPHPRSPGDDVNGPVLR